jgi:predicted enzyme related to lactoylglutathione lyase
VPQVTHVEWPAGDADRLQGFLEGLFGWEFNSPMEGVDYRMAQTGEQEGAAVYPSEDSARGLLVYYGVDDIDGCIDKVRGSGGQGEDKQPVPGMGWFSRCQDPEGNTFGLWQNDTSASAPEG